MSSNDVSEGLRQYIRDVPDFPKPGILFRDLTPLLGNAEALRKAVAAMTAPFREDQIDCVLGTEARGFIFGTAVALELGVGFVPARKPGKLPYQTREVSYDLEYGTDTVEMHIDGVSKGQRVLVVDDLIATGGTARATVELARQSGGEIVGCSFLIELDGLAGTATLGVDRIHSVLHY
ncbi:MAG: adenine phosphoribosyltransferase [Myxococcota bacterium]|nr:adenine phosphoribosyltransferase [Myxococcota bacterium]